MLGATVAHPQRPAGAVQLRGAALVVLGLEEVGQHVLPAPAFEAQALPLVVVEPAAPDVDHRVHGGRAAQHPAAGEVDGATVEMRLRVGLEVPVPFRLVELWEAGGDVDLLRRVGRSGLEQRHLDRRILAQPRGENAAGRAGTDDDVVEMLCHDHPPAVRIRPRLAQPPARAQVNSQRGYAGPS